MKCLKVMKYFYTVQFYVMLSRMDKKLKFNYPFIKKNSRKIFTTIDTYNLFIFFFIMNFEINYNALHITERKILID